MDEKTPKKTHGLLSFSTRSYPTFGRQRRPYDENNPPKTVTDSPYYWWYVYLKLNEDYYKTCQANGDGKLAGLYKDFGDIYTMNFKEWWQSRVILFAEPKPKYRMMVANSMSDIAPFNSDEVLNLVVPLNRSQRSLKKAFTYLVLKKLEKGRRGVSTETSEAKYKLSGKWHIEALKTAYKVYVTKKNYEKEGTKKAWADIAIEIQLPYANSLTNDKKINSDIRKTLTMLTIRYYTRAQQYINAAASNSFPHS